MMLDDRDKGRLATVMGPAIDDGMWELLELPSVTHLVYNVLDNIGGAKELEYIQELVDALDGVRAALTSLASRTRQRHGLSAPTEDVQTDDVQTDSVFTPGAAFFISSEYEETRGLAYSEYVAQRARLMPVTKACRQEVVGDAFLSRNEIEPFLMSSAVRRLSLAQLGAAGLLPARRILGSEPRIRTMDRRIILTVGQIERTIEVTDTDHAAFTHLTFEVRGHHRTTSVPIGSVASDIANVSDQIALKCPWSASQALTFLLTDETPSILPMHAIPVIYDGSIRHVAIKMTVEPWVSARRVEQEFRYMQRWFLQGENRECSLRNLRLFRFVNGKVGADGKIPAWPSLLREWNDCNPGERFSRRNVMWQACKNVANKLGVSMFEARTERPRREHYGSQEARQR